MGHIVRTCLLCLCLLALPDAGALAHAVLIEASPADGERIETAPAELRLHFSEPVSPVTDPPARCCGGRGPAGRRRAARRHDHPASVGAAATGRISPELPRHLARRPRGRRHPALRRWRWRPPGDRRRRRDALDGLGSCGGPLAALPHGAWRRGPHPVRCGGAAPATPRRTRVQARHRLGRRRDRGPAAASRASQGWIWRGCQRARFSPASPGCWRGRPRWAAPRRLPPWDWPGSRSARAFQPGRRWPGPCWSACPSRSPATPPPPRRAG